MLDRPVRLQLSRRPGFSLQALSLATNGRTAVNVARPSRYGNPHVAMPTWYHSGFPTLGLPAFDAVTKADAIREGRRIAVAMFRAEWQKLLVTRPDYARAELAPLTGRNIGCWCALPAPGEPDCCHGAVLIDLANPEHS